MQQKTKTGTSRLSEVAKYVVKPAGIASTGWPAVRKTCREKLGIEFDEWQHGCGRLALSKRADGKLATTVGGVGMSFARQVGKTHFWSGTTFGLSVNMPGLLSIWSAHHSKTHEETFLAMQAFAQRLRVAPYIEQVFTGSGDEEVRFVNGSRILFGARERGFGRGIPGVDILIMDEAQILSEKAMQNMLATMNTSRFALHAYIGTPPKPDDNSENFTRMRDEALEAVKSNAGLSEDLVWIECGADDGADLDDQKQWAKANPSFPHRTPIEAFQRLRKKLDADGFRREGLGVWDAKGLSVIDLAQWSSPPLLDRDAPQPGRVVLVIAVAPDRSWSCIGLAGDVAGKTLVLCFSMPGTSGVAAKVADLKSKQDVAEVRLAGAQAKELKPDLTKAGIEFEVMTDSEMGAACGAFQQAVKDGTVVHVGQAELDKAVENARTRRSGGVSTLEQWDRRDPKVDDSPLVAVSGAFYRWGLQPKEVEVWEPLWT